MRCISDAFVQKKKTTTSCLPNVELRTFQKMHFADNLSCLSEWMKKNERETQQCHQVTLRRFPRFNLDVTTTAIKRSLYSADVRVCADGKVLGVRRIVTP